MTRKHFKSIALMFSMCRPKDSDVDCIPEYAMWMRLRGEMILICCANNPRFDAHKFKEATEK